MTKRAPRPRDQEASAFSTILSDLVQRVPGAFAAALVDGDGECVDYGIAPQASRAYDVEAFDVKAAAAHWAIALFDIVHQPSMTAVSTIICRGETRSFVVRCLPDKYAIVLMLKRRGGFASIERAVSAAERSLAQEAAWKLPKGRGVWIAVDVEMDERRRPTWLTTGSLSCAVEVLGGLTNLSRRERGWRVRLPAGGELNLVREVGNRWYADEKLG